MTNINVRPKPTIFQKAAKVAAGVVVAAMLLNIGGCTMHDINAATAQQPTADMVTERAANEASNNKFEQQIVNNKIFLKAANGKTFTTQLERPQLAVPSVEGTDYGRQEIMVDGVTVEYKVVEGRELDAGTRINRADKSDQDVARAVALTLANTITGYGSAEGFSTKQIQENPQQVMDAVRVAAQDKIDKGDWFGSSPYVITKITASFCKVAYENDAGPTVGECEAPVQTMEMSASFFQKLSAQRAQNQLTPRTAEQAMAPDTQIKPGW